MREKIVLIGAGNIGLRYLQALCLTEKSYRIYVVDLSERALKNAEEIFKKNPIHHEISYYTELEKLPERIDIACITTSSNIRREIVEKLLKICKLKYLILEKFLFNYMDDYEIVNGLLQNHKVKSWVNCTRRAQDAYINLKEELLSSSFLEITVSGSNWGLGCNAIHFLDLIEFLSGNDNITVNIDKLDNRMIESKRKGFKEITGTITGSMGKCRSLSITSYGEGNMDVSIMITSDKTKFVIDEGRQKIFRYQGNGEWSKEPFKLLYTSEIMQLIISDILATGECQLANYEEASELHKKLQVPLTYFFADKGINNGECPIT